ncbi:ankyrin repeat domain-containing protein [Salmonella enterica subsp. salamae]|nr:ankyrin repeat domain-containing protein [Salmonella enterica subsp. salamae]ECJ2281241.1 ankyrin repeat domain-containing protein [Salmonella enterica subsp. salamae]HCC0890598.1 ankyrin repeat domain-containing protein [Salmonella enterica]
MSNFYSSDFPDFFCNPGNYHLKSKLHADYPINNAAFFGDIEKVRELIKLGVDIDARGDLGYTALHHAVYQGYVDIVRLLLESGSNIYLETELGNSVFDLAIMVERYDIHKILSDYSSPKLKVTLSELLVNYSKRYFYGDTIDLESITECGEYPIHIAVKRKKIDEVRCLINAGANLNVKTDDGLEFTPLHYSIGKKCFEIMRLLLKNNAAYELKSGMGYSPLDLAVIMGDKKSIFYLYEFITSKKDND